MQLHRSTGQADWQTIPVSDYSSWQQLAARTNGIATPGNLFTILGLALVLAGLWRIQLHEYWIGLGGIAFGRACDLIDGQLAERTRTKSPLGEKLDAGFDKLASLSAFILLVTAHVLPLEAAVVLLLPNLSNALLTIIANHKGIGLHPTRNGKLGMAASWLAAGAYLLAACLRLSAGSWAWWLGTLLTICSLMYGILAGIDYFRTIRRYTK